MELEAKFEYLHAMSSSEEKKELLQELMQGFGRDVWNYAFSMTGKWDMADDITQDVFIKAYRNLHTFRRKSSVKTWLLTITRNTSTDYLRSSYFRRVTLVDQVRDKGHNSSAEQQAIETLEINEIWKKVFQLPIKYREVLILFAHNQLSMKEISNLLEVSEGTVKSRLHHARLKMAKIKEL